MQYDYHHREQIPVYANGLKDVPEALKRHHWMVPVKFDQLQRLQLKVRMCCQKCEEKVKEEIEEVPGVFDVQVMRPKTVIVEVMPDPFGVNEKEVLRKAKKIDCRAKFVMLEERYKRPKKPDPTPKPPQVEKPAEPKPPKVVPILPDLPSCWESPSCPGAHGCPSKPYGCPSKPYGYPSKPYGCPSKPYGYPSKPYGCPSKPYGCPSKPYGCPSKPQYEDDCHLHYFHLLLLALFAFVLGHAMR